MLSALVLFATPLTPPWHGCARLWQWDGEGEEPLSELCDRFFRPGAPQLVHLGRCQALETLNPGDADLLEKT